MVADTPDVLVTAAGDPPLVSIGACRAVTAGSYEHRTIELVSGWHQHDVHELEYAVSGVAELVSPSAHHMLPPSYAAWIPAGAAHSAILRDVTTVAVFFDPEVFEFPHREIAVLPVPPLLREMIRYSTRWPVHRADEDEESEAYFTAMADVVRRQLELTGPAGVPLTDDALVGEVMAYTVEHLDRVTSASVCRSVGISERTLRRRFPSETGMTWRQYLQQTRLRRAMALLARSDRSVSQVALDVGFSNASTLARALRSWTGETPSAYRDRWLRADSVPEPPARPHGPP